MSDIKKKFFMTLGAVLLVQLALVAAFYYLLQAQFLPLLEKFSITQRAIDKAEQEQAFYRSVVLPDLEENKTFFEGVQSLFYKPQGDPEAFEKAVIFFEQTAARNDLTYQITQTPTEQLPAFGVQVTGTFSDIMKFVQEVENSAYLLEITRFTIDNGVSGDHNAFIVAVLET